MKVLFSILSVFFGINVFASTIDHCVYFDQGNKVIVPESNIQTDLKINISWSYRDDCPQSIGVKYNSSNGSGVEYHSLLRSEKNTQGTEQSCIYALPSGVQGKFSNVACMMSL